MQKNILDTKYGPQKLTKSGSFTSATMQNLEVCNNYAEIQVLTAVFLECITQFQNFNLNRDNVIAIIVKILKLLCTI